MTWPELPQVRGRLIPRSQSPDQTPSISSRNDICAHPPRSIAGNLAQKTCRPSRACGRGFARTPRSVQRLSLGRPSRAGVFPQGGGGGGRQGRRTGHPETDEKREGFSKNGEILVEALDLATEPVEPPGERGLHAFACIAGKEGRDRRLDDGGFRDVPAQRQCSTWLSSAGSK